MKVSRVVVLDNRSIGGNHSKCVDWESNFITEGRVHLDGQGRLQV
jgi:hypothetical protein